MAHVLVIDDEPTIVHALEIVLRYAGHQVRTAPHGLAGLQQLQIGPLPDIVLMDLYMPWLSGRDLVGTMRSNPRFSNIPVILLTGAVPSPDEFPEPGTYQALIQKPFSVREVVAKVNELLQSEVK